MNKFVKVILIISGVLFGLGVVCVIAAFSMGADIRDLGGALPDHINRIEGIEFEYNQSQDNGLQDSYESTDKEGNAAATFTGVRDLNIEAGAGAVEIVRGDVENVELYYDQSAAVEAYLDEGELEIECNRSGSETMKIVVPNDMQLYEINLEIGAGRVVLENIGFVNLDAEVGAGELIVYAPEAAAAYDYDVDYGIGTVQIGEESYVGIGSAQKRDGAAKFIDIDCGAGNVEIYFTEE